MNSAMKKALFDLRLRLALICVFTTGILLCAMAAVLLGISEKQMDIQREASFRNSANSIVYRLQSSRVIDDAWLSRIESGDRLIAHIEDNTRPILFRGSWTPRTDRNALVRLAHSMALSDFGFDPATRPWSVLATESVTFEMKGAHGEGYLVSITLIPSDIGWQSLTLLKDLENDARVKFLMRVSFFAVILISLLLLLLLGLWISKRAIRPIEANNQRQAEFIAAASHELRAPLAVIKAGLSSMPPEDDPESLRRFHAAAGRECDRMSRLIGDLLLLANADANQWPFAAETVDMDTLLTELYESFEPVAKAKKQKLSLRLPEEPLPLTPGDRQRLNQAMASILDNAICYTPEYGNIRVYASADKHHLSVSISDDGPGIPDQEKSRVFDRFYRAAPFRSGKDHYGLGLSVAREILSLHRGGISVSDSPEGGARFTIRLPLR